MTEKCGRLTKAGTPCKITRAATAGWHTALRAEAPACLIHLTRDERAVYIPGDWFERYREKNPATILGIEIRYFSPFTGWAEPDPGPGSLDQHPAYVLAEYLRA